MLCPPRTARRYTFVFYHRSTSGIHGRHCIKPFNELISGPLSKKMREEPSARLQVQNLVDHSSGEDGQFDPKSTWEYFSTTVQFMTSRDLAELIRSSEEILTDNPQWRRLVTSLKLLHTLQTKPPSILRLLNPGNLIEYARYAMKRGQLKAIYEGSSPTHSETFMHLQSSAAALAYIDAILESEQALPPFKSTFIDVLRDLDAGIDSQEIKGRNGRANMQIVEN